MNVLRVFDKAVMKQKMKNEFINEYVDCIEEEYAYGTVKLQAGMAVWFRCVRSMEDAHLLSGVRFSVVEYYGSFHEDIVQYLNSRIRSY